MWNTGDSMDSFIRTSVGWEFGKASNLYKLGQMQMERDLGIEVSEVTFDQFERRKAPRGG